METMDLKALRCPYAMSIVRRAIASATDSKFVGMVEVKTIEKELHQHILTVINSEQYNITVASSETEVLDEALKASWIASGDAHDGDLVGVSNRHAITLRFF
ncbi:hypothetical protein [Vibrio sp. R78045]|uniref:hypothetical protein n=1 Tax=Vibrio sp. R78045 TaxID=3093868 RepID=UPI0036F27AF3